jgi:hypothetical protein
MRIRARIGGHFVISLSSDCHRMSPRRWWSGSGRRASRGSSRGHPEDLDGVEVVITRRWWSRGGRQPALNAETATTPQNGPETPQDERLRWGVRSSQGGRCQTAASRCLRGSSSFTDHLLHDRMHDRVLHDQVLHDRVLRSGQCGGGEDQPSGNRPDLRSARRTSSTEFRIPAMSRYAANPGPRTNAAASSRKTLRGAIRSRTAISQTAAARH